MEGRVGCNEMGLLPLRQSVKKIMDLPQSFTLDLNHKSQRHK